MHEVEPGIKRGDTRRNINMPMLPSLRCFKSASDYISSKQ